MDAHRLRDRLFWGLNRVANVLGDPTDAYRPKGTTDPLNRSNRFLRLRAVFSRADGNFAQPVGYGEALWRGHFDASYTKAGDYLVRERDIWFIAAQQSLLPVLCVKANRTISISRPATPGTGTTPLQPIGDPGVTLISGWPVSMLGIRTEGRSPTRLPGDTMVPNVIVLLPAVDQVYPRPTDIVTDDLAGTGTIVAAELGELGWRLNVRRVTT